MVMSFYLLLMYLAVAWIFPEDTNINSVPSEFRTGDNDWSAVFNPIIKRVLDVQLVHKLIHNGCVSYVLAQTFIIKFSSPVSCIMFSLDGRYLAAAFSKTTQIYDIKSGVIRWYVMILTNRKLISFG